MYNTKFIQYTQIYNYVHKLFICLGEYTNDQLIYRLAPVVDHHRLRGAHSDNCNQ